MPTENRSSNTEMVSDLLPCPFCGEKPQITKHHREDIYSFMHRCPVLGPISWGFREDPQAHVEKWNARAQPISQPHPEPIAWMVGTAFWWTKEEAERDAAAIGLPIVGLGPMPDTSELEQLVAANTEYAHRHLEQLDEAERLRAENEKLREGISKHWKVVCDQRAEIDILRAKLAKWDMLLREIADHCNGCVMPTEQLLREWGSSIDAALSASAEPSAPTWSCQPCKIEQPTDRPCDACSGATELKI